MARTRQPVRVAPAEFSGERTQLTELQQAAPVPQAPPPGAVPAAAGGPGRAPLAIPPQRRGLFDPTERPSEPITTGVPFGPGASPDPILSADPDLILKAMYQAYPDPEILSLLRNR